LLDAVLVAPERNERPTLLQLAQKLIAGEALS
jgi:hypothetical protein